jgi:hypothetical protein
MGSAGNVPPFANGLPPMSLPPFMSGAPPPPLGAMGDPMWSSSQVPLKPQHPRPIDQGQDSKMVRTLSHEHLLLSLVPPILLASSDLCVFFSHADME